MSMSRLSNLIVFIISVYGYIHYVSGLRSKHRVAFVYAGSARTFKEPFVHESQRINLINAFCPPRICQSTIFARISLSDNKHQDENGLPVLDGRGIPIPADEKEKPAIEFALSRLVDIPNNAFHTHSIPLVVTWSDIGTESDEKEMATNFPGIRHKMFRTFDRRRYSMYYNRYKAYEQIFQYEKEHQMQFTWVVHVRLDSIWGEPILPVSYWSTLGPSTNHAFNKFENIENSPIGQRIMHKYLQSHNSTIDSTGASMAFNSKLKLKLTDNSMSMSSLSLKHADPKVNKELKVWVVDTWWCEVPDTFALLPRSLSNAYFSLNGLVKEGAMCLGGPNFDYSAVAYENISSTVFNEEEKQLIKATICPRDEMGHSEMILKRKLQVAGIDLDRGNLGYTTLFMSIVRKDLTDLCFFLESHRIIGWIFDKQFSNMATPMGCFHLMSLWRYQKREHGGMLTRSHMLSSGANHDQFKHHQLISTTTRDPFTSVCRLESRNYTNRVVREYGGINCLLDRKKTDWNFMPFRLHKHDKCFTYDPFSATNTSIRLGTCENTISKGGTYSVVYNENQLLHLFPMLESSQQLQVHSYGNGIDGMNCITTNTKGLLVFAPCIVKGNSDSKLSPKKFGPHDVPHSDQLEDYRADTRDILSQQYLIKVRHDMSGSNFHTGSLTKRNKVVSRSSNLIYNINNPHAQHHAMQSIQPVVLSISVAQIRTMDDLPHLDAWYHNRDYAPVFNSSLVCMTALSGADVDGGSDFAMAPCDSHDSNQILVLERTTVFAWLKYIRVYMEQNHYMKEFENLRKASE